MKGIGANIGLAINISHQVLVNPENIERVRELLWEFSFPASRLTFELSESEELDESVAPQIDAFQQMGIKISIDDFGSGYSNFNKVLSLNIDEIKFDRSIINNNEMRSAALIKNILQFCRDFGITSVAGAWKILTLEFTFAIWGLIPIRAFIFQSQYESTN